MQLNPGYLQIAYWPLVELRANPRDPRRHNYRQIRRPAEVIVKLGFNVPLPVDQASNIVAGHAHYEAAQRLSLTEVPTIRLERMAALGLKPELLE